MARLLAMLTAGVGTGFLASMFQVPNMIPLMLVVIWLGMGCGLRVWYAIIGAVLMPLAIVLPMWILPGPGDYGRLLPPDDSRMIELFYVADAMDQHRTAVAESKQAEDAPRPTLHESNIAAAESFIADSGSAYRVWPRAGAYTIGLIVTLLSWMANLITTKPFRAPQPLGQP